MTNAPVGQRSGLVPEGDVRLTANIRRDLHLKLKLRAAQDRTTVGELIEQWVEGWSKTMRDDYVDAVPTDYGDDLHPRIPRDRKVSASGAIMLLLCTVSAVLAVWALTLL